MRLLRSLAVSLCIVAWSTSANAVLLGRIDVGNPMLVVEVTATDITTVSGSPAVEINMLVTNYTASTYICRGKIGFYQLATGSTSAFPVTAEQTIPPGGPWLLVSAHNSRNSGLGHTLAYDSASCELAPSAGAGGAGSGNPNMSGTVGYTIDPQSKTIVLRASRITNPSPSTTTGSLELQLVAADGPYNGGSLRAYTLGYSQLPSACGYAGTLEPGVSCTDVSLRTAYTAPPPGTYTAVLLLTEYDSTQCAGNRNQCIVDWFNFTKPLVIEAEGNIAGLPDTGGVEIVGGGQYQLNWTTNRVRLELDEVRNASRTRTTGTLRLEVWLTEQPYTSGDIAGYRLMAERLPGSCSQTLAPGASCINMTIDVPMLTRPPAGTYYVTVVVAEYDDQNCLAQDRFCIVTSRSGSANTVPAPQTTPPPAVPPPPPTGGGGGGGGGGGAIGLEWLVLGLLGALLRGVSNRVTARRGGRAGAWQRSL